MNETRIRNNTLLNIREFHYENRRKEEIDIFQMTYQKNRIKQKKCYS